MSQPPVLVLAGGASQRFWPLRDKPLLEFAGTSLLARHLRQLRALGCERFVVVCRPETAAAVRAIAAAVGLPDARVALQDEARGMADGVLAARQELATFGEGALYVTQAQDVVEPELHAALLDRWAHGPEDVYALVAAARVKEYFPGGYLSLDGDRVRSIVEKPGFGREPSDLVNLVAHVFADWRPLIERLETENARPGPNDAYERALAALMAERDFRAVLYEGRWRALKYPWHVLDVMALLLDRLASGAEPAGDEYTAAGDGVVLGRDVRILPGAHVVPPAVIGSGTVIGHNALVRGSLVGPNCVIGFGSEVARSYLAEAVQLHHNYIGDSVLDRGALLGWGATTANFRLDGRTVPSDVSGQRLDTGREKFGLVLGAGAKVGVNASLMPGIKIGAGVIVGPGIRLDHDVPDGARVLTQAAADAFAGPASRAGRRGRGRL